MVQAVKSIPIPITSDGLILDVLKPCEWLILMFEYNPADPEVPNPVPV